MSPPAILPAHLPQLETWIDGLSHELRSLCSVGVQKWELREILARSIGYAGGRVELLEEIRRPHEPRYLESLASEAERDAVIEGLACEISAHQGSNVPLTDYIACVENSLVGRCPIAATELREQRTPWGLATERRTLDVGIHRVKTKRRTGFVLSEDRYRAMPQHLRSAAHSQSDQPFFSDPMDSLLVVLCYPSVSEDFALIEALQALDVFKDRAIYSGDSVTLARFLAGCVMENSEPQLLRLVEAGWGGYFPVTLRELERSFRNCHVSLREKKLPAPWRSKWELRV